METKIQMTTTLAMFRTTAQHDHPVGDVWTPVSALGAPPGGTGYTSVWSGKEMLVWKPSQGGRYDPLVDEWTPISPAPLVGGSGHSAVWTDCLMVIWGGGTNAGARYDPTTDGWEVTTAVQAPSSRSDHTAVWDGNGMIV